MDRGLCSFLGIISLTASQANRANGRPGVGRGRVGEISSPMQIARGSAVSEGGTELGMTTGRMAMGQGWGNKKNFLGLILGNPRTVNALLKVCI